MAWMLAALNLCPGMRVLEIGAGTGYNAALITTITKAPVVTVDAGATTAQGAAESIRWLGLDHHVTVLHGDGYFGEPNSAPYDRIIVTCGVAGLSPYWLDQLAPIAHGGVHPVLAATNHDGTVRARAALWADFMSAAGPLRPAELVGHDPADYVPSAPVTRIPDISPACTTATYNDLWFFLATRDSRITRAYMDDDTVDTAKRLLRTAHAPTRDGVGAHRRQHRRSRRAHRGRRTPFPHPRVDSQRPSSTHPVRRHVQPNRHREAAVDAKPMDAGRHGHRCSCHQVAAGSSGVGSEATERVNAGRSSTGRSDTGLGHTVGWRLWRASA